MVNSRVFELRTYYPMPGKFDAVLTRFREHTVALFRKHGMTSIGYFTPADDTETLVYLLAHDSREAAAASWAAFQADPDWIAAKAASTVDGEIVHHLESVYLNPTDFSELD